MAMRGILAVLIFGFSWLALECLSKGNNSYLILSPKVFWPGRTLTLKVTILKASEPVNVTASVQSGYYGSPKNLIVSSSGVFTAGSTADLNIKVPSGLPSNSYQLTVNGSGGLTFYNESYIEFRSKGMSIYVQMDKGVYKPGQTVHMRVFALLPNLKSYTGKMTVDILDPNSNKMARWANVQGDNGIIKKDLLLSTQPVMGEWKVMVNANGEKYTKTFEVKEYVLPKFDVAVILPAYVVRHKDKTVPVKISSKYTYGKGVKGKVRIYGFFKLYWPKKHFCFNDTAPLKIDGSVSMQLSIAKIMECFGQTFKSWHSTKSMIYKGWYPLTLIAKVEEGMTGKEYSGESSIKFYYSDIKLEFPSFNPQNYKPGLDFITMLKVTKPNGEPQSDPDKLRKVKVTVKTKYQWDGKQIIDDYTPSDDGIIVIKRKVPAQNATIVHMEAEYRVDKEFREKAYFTAYEFVSPSASFIQLSTSTPSVKSGDKIDCKVISSFPVTSYVYLVMARGKIRERKSGNAANGQQFSFSVISSSIMAPMARVVVYTMRNDGEVVVDSLSITIENPFENEVSVKYSRSSSGPGDQINLVATASPGSQVAFLVVDKSVLLMKKDNDLSRDKILQDLRSYTAGSGWYPWWQWEWYGSARRSQRMIMPFPTSGSDAMSVFQNSGLIVFSDCLVYRKTSYNIYLMDSASGARPMLHASADGNFMRKTASGPGAPLAAVTKIRSLFPETWIWMDVNASSAGEAEISTSVPDTITSWVASAFAISPKTGFGIAVVKPQLKVFQPFFVSLDLPYSLVRGEEVAIKALVFNYLEQPQEVTITFKASEDWEAINEISTARGQYEQEAVDIKEVLTIPAGQGKAVAFPIKPKTLGNIPLVVQAQSTVAADAVKRTILVKPEGVPNSYSYSVLIDLNTTSSFTKTLELALPKSVVKGSARAKVSVIGDILGSSFNNLDDLLRMPYGCGEQNMVNFAPNIFVLKYLTTVKKVTPAIKTKAETYMVQGYQREQTYRHKDGSYSAFGERDPEGSMWLTAFVVKSFAQARKYIYVDPDSLLLSLGFIARKQNKDGSFPGVGKVHSSYLKGGMNGKVSLTAYVVVALAEADSPNKVVMLAKQEGIRYLESNLDDVILKKDVYALALSAYALRLVNSVYSEKARLALLSLAIRKDGMVHWSNDKKDSHQSTTYRPYYRPRSADVEITAYALLTFSLNKDISNGLPVVRWLSVQRNSLGGYASTQDTVLGIQAMSEFAALIYSSSQNFQVKLTQSADKSFSKTFTVNKDNAMVLQQVLMPKVTGTLTVTANGHGIGMLQVGVTYNVDKVPEKTDFEFIIEILKEGRYVIETKSCATWRGDGANSDMAVMELGVVSGFSPNQDAIDKLLNDKRLAVKRVDKEDQKLVLYFDQINKDKATCIKMLYERTHPVGKSQPVPAVVYDYYNPEHRAEALYSSDKLSQESVCRVCTMCVNCKLVLDPTTGETKNFGPKLASSLVITLIVVAVAHLFSY